MKDYRGSGNEIYGDTKRWRLVYLLVAIVAIAVVTVLLVITLVDLPGSSSISCTQSVRLFAAKMGEKRNRERNVNKR